jgi:dipeptidyl aminopeptidase/acylaminoacyl peptidase
MPRQQTLRGPTLARLTVLAALCSLIPYGPTSAAAQSQRLPAPAALVLRDGIPPTEAAVAATLPSYSQGRSAHFLDWLADGSLLITTRFGDTWQIHQLHAPLGMRAQISFEPGGVLTAAAQPFSSDTLVYLAGHGADTQLELEQLHDHSVRALTGGTDRVSEPVWSPDGRQLAFISNRRGPAYDDVYVLDVSATGAASATGGVDTAGTAGSDSAAGGEGTGGSEPVTPRLVAATLEGRRWRIEGWSADAHQLLLGSGPMGSPAGAEGTAGAAGAASAAAADDYALYIADVDHGSVSPVPALGAGHASRRRRRAPPSVDSTGAAEALHMTAARFATDGRGILVLTYAQPAVRARAAAPAGRFLHLSLLDPASDSWRDLSAPAPHDVELFDESADGHYLAYTLDVGGQSQLMLLDQRLQLSRAVTAVPPGVISSLRFDASGAHLALTLESARSPPDVYVLDLGTQVLTRWTHSEIGPFAPQSFIEPQTLTFPTWDRIDGQPRQLQALLYNPAPRGTPGPPSVSGPPTSPALPDTPADGSRPVVIWLCSGAGTQCRPGYDPFVQYLVRTLGFAVIAPNVRGSSGLGANLLDAGSGALRDDAPRDVGALLAWISVQPGLDRSRVALFGEGYGGYLALESLSQYPDSLLGAVVAFPPPLAGLPNVAAIRAPVLLVQAGDADGDAPGYEVAQLREGLRSQGVTVQYLAAQAPDAFSARPARFAYHAAAASFLVRLLR